MADTVKVPLLGPTRKGPVIAVTVIGFGGVGYLFYRSMKKKQAAAQAAATAQSSAGYGYGQVYGYGASYGYGAVANTPGGSYGYGTGGGSYPPGYYGYGGPSSTPLPIPDSQSSNPPPPGINPAPLVIPDQNWPQPNPPPSIVTVPVPQVTGDRAKVARQALRHAGLSYNISDRATGIVKSQNPRGGTPVQLGSTVNLTL